MIDDEFFIADVFSNLENMGVSEGQVKVTGPLNDFIEKVGKKHDMIVDRYILTMAKIFFKMLERIFVENQRSAFGHMKLAEFHVPKMYIFVGAWLNIF